MLQLTMPKRRRLLQEIAILAVVISMLIYGSLQSYSVNHSQPASGPTPTLEVELITLRPAGFEPAGITRPKGSFVLFIDDRSGKESSALLLQHARGERVRALNLNRRKTEWNDVLDLSPGTYILHDAGDRELRCQITILP